jgi:hypothetical protein
MAIKVIFITTTGAGTWTVPSDWTSANSIECVGAGGGGRVAAAGGGGGGGGAYSSISNTAAWSPGQVKDFSVGAGGAAGASGGDTWIGATTLAASLVGAKGGTGATAATGAAGGLNTSGFPASGGVRNSGGAGGLGSATIFTGGGGGGAGGPGGTGGVGGAGDATATGADFGGGGGSGAGLTTVGGAGGAGTTAAGAGGTNATSGGSGGAGGAGDGVSATAATALWTSTHLPDATTTSVVGAATGGGGGGGGSATAGAAGSGANYGGAGGGRGLGTGGTSAGGQGLIIITYDNVPPPPSVTEISIASVAYASRTNTVIGKPTVSVGDSMVAVYIGTGGSPTIAQTVTPPSGWIEYTATPFTTLDAFGLAMVARVYVREVDGTEGASFQWTHVAKNTVGAILGFTNVDGTSPFGAMAQSSGTGGTSTYPTITPTAHGGILAAATDYGDTLNNLSPPSGTPTLVERLDSVVLYISTADNVAGTATGSRTQTNNSTGTSPWWAMQLALQPAADAAPPAVVFPSHLIRPRRVIWR